MKWIFTLILATTLAHAHSGETFIVEAPTGTHWAKWTNSEEMNVQRLVELLQRSETGKKLVADATRKARSNGFTLFDVIKAGEG